jgi:hypothetical protein
LSDALRYRVIDEPREGPLQRFGLPPTLVFIAATFFTPWGFLLIALNAVAVSGPERAREIALAGLALFVYFAAKFALGTAVAAKLIALRPAIYVFEAAVGLAFVCLAFACISQYRAFELRQYLRQQQGR